MLHSLSILKYFSIFLYVKHLTQCLVQCKHEDLMAECPFEKNAMKFLALDLEETICVV